MSQAADRPRRDGVVPDGNGCNLRVDGVEYVCQLDDFKVLNEDGGELSAGSAAVLVALGGEEPSWLKVVEALTAVNEVWPGSTQALTDACLALDDATGRNAEAATTTRPAGLLALATFGTPSAGANPACSRLVWDKLLYHRYMWVSRMALRQNRILPPWLGDHPDEQTRIRVARNPDCLEHQLAWLAASSAAVRLEVAGNPSAGAPTLRRCAADSNWPTRQAVARNAAVPMDAVARLLKDPISQVRTAMILNPVVPRGVLVTRLRDPTPAVHEALARRKELAIWDLSRLERRARADEATGYARTRGHLGAHPSCNRFLRRRLARMDTKLTALPDAQRDTYEAFKSTKRTQNTIAYYGCREIVSFWYLDAFLASLVLLAHHVVVVAAVMLAGLLFGGGAIAWWKGPFLHWFPARRTRTAHAYRQQVFTVCIPVAILVASHFRPIGLKIAGRYRRWRPPPAP